MKEKKITADSVWQEYQKDVSFKEELNLFEKTKQHHKSRKKTEQHFFHY